MNRVKTIFLVDNRPAWRNEFKVSIEKEQDLCVTLVTSFTALADKSTKVDYSLLICDLEVIGVDELEYFHRTSDKPIIISYPSLKSPELNRLLELGVIGFIDKTASPAQMVRTIRNALEGMATLPVALLQRLHTVHEDILLSNKERSILEWVALGKSNKELATLLYVSQRTVEYHLTRIFNKFNVRTRSEAVMMAKSKGMIHM
ncbi:UNVERIFIED_CONTAM: two-component system competent response regulator ComA [Paenibacillus sp. PvR008]